MATETKKEKKIEAYPWKADASSGHTTNLKQSILRLSISMIPSYQKVNKSEELSTVSHHTLCLILPGAYLQFWVQLVASILRPY